MKSKLTWSNAFGATSAFFVFDGRTVFGTNRKEAHGKESTETTK
jgi:hypothetical protein